MMHLELPALDGRLPLGFLAACGVLRLLTEDAGSTGRAPRLSWDEHTATALLHGFDDLDELVELLHQMALDIDEDALLPGGPADFPGSTKIVDAPRGDPMRSLAERFRGQVAEWRSQHGTEFVDTWVPAMVTDQVVDDARCVAISPFAAPSGQQKFATMFEKNLGSVRAHSGSIRQALTGWRRVEGVTGEYLDHHVLRSAADRSDGKSQEAGVPGATWLALMALPLFPTVAGRSDALAGAWQAVPMGRRRTRNIFTWPLWSEPLDIDAVQTILTHPGLRVEVVSPRGEERPGLSAELFVDLRPLRPLSVFYVGAAERRRISGRNFAGVLTPTPLRHSRPSPSDGPGVVSAMVM